MRPHFQPGILKKSPHVEGGRFHGSNQPRRSHEILIPTVPLAGWDVAFVAQEDPKAPAKLVWKPGG